MSGAQAGVPPIDWLARWEAAYDAERAQAEQLGARPPGDDRWAGQAARFARATQRSSQPDAVMRWLLPHLRANDTLIDIGAGTGRHTGYLASRIQQVIAVEPSPAMRSVLVERVASLGSGAARIVPTPWPDARAEGLVGEIVLAAHVVYGVRAIGPFLQGMDQAAQRLCVVVAGFRPPAAFIAPFWEQIYGVAKVQLPGAIECLHALAQLGIDAQLALIPSEPMVFADEEEARADICWRLRISHDGPSPEALESVLATHLARLPDGQLFPRQQPGHYAVIWWTPTAITGSQRD